MQGLKEAKNGTVESHAPFKNKAERYGWRSSSSRGRLEWISKGSINIDHDYQRDRIANAKVLEIASNWCWMACGVILVAKRADGSYWAYDGQHRVLASRRRDDIDDLPCLVFDVSEKREEAQGFVRANTVRGPIRALEKFKARLVEQDHIALQVASLIEACGYKVCSGPGKFNIECVGAIESELLRDRETAETVLLLCADIYSGDQIHSRVFKGLSYLHNKLKKCGERISRPDVRKKLMALGPAELERACNSAVGYRGKGGERVYADGLATVINKGKSSRVIPAVFD